MSCPLCWRDQTYPKDFRDVAMLLLLNSQAHERRAPNPAARVPPVVWQQVRLWLHTYVYIYI
jgi:hypothetical protein